jgi:hypothetical protein
VIQPTPQGSGVLQAFSTLHGYNDARLIAALRCGNSSNRKTAKLTAISVRIDEREPLGWNAIGVRDHGCDRNGHRPGRGGGPESNGWVESANCYWLPLRGPS